MLPTKADPEIYKYVKAMPKIGTSFLFLKVGF